MDKDRLYLALGIISGRIENGDNFSDADWVDFGFDPFRFSSFGTPDNTELKRQSETAVRRVYDCKTKTF